MKESLKFTSTELVKYKMKEELRTFVSHEIVSALDDVQEVQADFDEDYRFSFNTNEQFVHLIVDIYEHNEDSTISYTVYHSEEEFKKNPSFGKHHILSDVRLRGPISRTLPQVLTVLKNLPKWT